MNDRVICFTMGQCIVLAIIVTGIIGHSELKCDKANNGIGVNCIYLEPLSEIMWETSLETADNAYNTEFVQRLNNGSLDPTQFGAYVVQDAVYLEKQSDALMIASQNESSMQLREFLTGKAIKNMGYATDMYKEWQLSDSSSVKLDSACEAYTEYKINIAKTLDPKYSIVAMIPCLRLWPWIGGKFESGEQGVYAKWVNANFDPTNEGYKKYEEMVDDWFNDGLISKELAKEIYRNCMEGEFLFFDRATK